MTPYTDNKPELRFENLPQPAQLRIFELMAALAGALALPTIETIEPKPVETPAQDSIHAGEVSYLKDYRDRNDKTLSTEEAQYLVENAFKTDLEAAA